MSRTVEFEFKKNWGSIKKGSKKTLSAQIARSLQDVRKVGKIVKEDKSDKDATKRATK